MKFREVFDGRILALEQNPDRPIEVVWRQLTEELGLRDPGINEDRRIRCHVRRDRDGEHTRRGNVPAEAYQEHAEYLEILQKAD